MLSDANRSNPDFNQGQYDAFDPEDQLIGIETKADKVHHSEDPMDSKWKGHEVTHKAILSGKFKGRTRQPKEEPILGSGY